MRNRAFRRHQAETHMWRRLKEDRNQHYDRLACPCWTDPKTMAFFKEQPKRQCVCCSNPRHNGWGPKLTFQEDKALEAFRAEMVDGS